jgi:archaemetzincin
MQKLLWWMISVLLFTSCGKAVKRDITRVRVGIVSLGQAWPGHLEAVKLSIDSFYHADAVIIPARQLPSMAWYQPRQRYKADSLLSYLLTVKPDSIDKIIGITTKDISTGTAEHPDWGIFGLATIGGKVCVVSSHRLQAAKADAKKVRERIQKVALHELGILSVSGIAPRAAIPA